jgi:two-component system CheB/CheR fusion protein
MNNQLAGMNIGMIFVDHQLRIQRFTPAATDIISLIQTDVGRPVADIVSRLIGYDRLVEDTQSVLDTLVPKVLEVQSKAGQWYQMRIQPYRTLQNVIEGAVLTFVEITREKKLLESKRESERRNREILESTRRKSGTGNPEATDD